MKASEVKRYCIQPGKRFWVSTDGEYILAADFDTYVKEEEERLQDYIDVMEIAYRFIRAMAEWNRDVEAIIGRYPSTGFQTAGDFLPRLKTAIEKEKGKK